MAMQWHNISTLAQTIQIISPVLHHADAFGQIFGSAVGIADGVLFFVGKLAERGIMSGIHAFHLTGRYSVAFKLPIHGSLCFGAPAPHPFGAAVKTTFKSAVLPICRTL